MKRILFVDDDPLVFEGLQRMLAPQNGQWEMSFAPEGETALLLLAATPFDVVVSDLRMPKMDGAVLLKTVRERWPSVVRIILSGKADMEDALRAAPVAHQCLLKPCDPAMLRSAIERATNLSELLSSKLLAGIVGSVQDLPVMPRAYIELRDALSNPNYSLKKIVRIVEQDVGISAKILQLVNSAFFGLPKDISSVHIAVCYLGAEMLQNLVLSAEVFHVFEKGKAIKEFSFEDLHIHSQLTAKIAGSLLPPSPTRDAATIAGLLHDVGKLILATRSPQHFARAIQGSRVEKLPLYRGGTADSWEFLTRKWGPICWVCGDCRRRWSRRWRTITFRGKFRARRSTQSAPSTSRTRWRTSIRCILPRRSHCRSKASTRNSSMRWDSRTRPRTGKRWPKRRHWAYAAPPP